MFFARSCLAVLVPFTMFSGVACTETGNQVSSVSDAAAPQDDDADAGIPCDATGVSKGPWTLAMNSSSITIRWESCRMGAIGEVVVTPVGSDSDAGASMTVTSTESPYVVSTTYKAPLNMSAPPDYAGTFYMHDAHLSGLAPSTCFNYALVADPSRKGKFCTARNAGEPIRFLAIGDTNPTLGPATGNVLANTLPMNPDFIVHVGDIQYYDSTVETWGSWFPVMQPMLSAGSFFPAIGNHEAETATEYADYVVRFFGGAGFDGPMPADAQDQYYRYESGGVWFFVLDTELPLDANADQTVWLAASLADAAAQPGFRFSIVYFHKPFVTCGDTGDNPPARAVFEPMFAKYKVPLVIQGHMHGYERFTFPGLTYLTAAGGGGALGDVSQNVARPECSSRTTFGRFYSATVIDVGAGAGATIHGVTIDDSAKTQDTFDIPIPN
ncbi:MAG: metallophosphoesterase [Polyangiaceae bacterium]